MGFEFTTPPYGPQVKPEVGRRAALNVATFTREKGWSNTEIKDTLGALGLIDFEAIYPPMPPIPSWQEVIGK